MSTASPPLASAPQLPEAPLSYRLARRVTEYGRLMRLDRPVGTWLLLWPALWALWIAGSGRPRPEVLLLIVALYLVTRLDLLTVQLAAIGALLTVSYPLFKRFFPMPQLYLGISFGGWSVPMAFAAQTGALPRVAWVLYIAAVIWAAMYDTLYALVDREDDLKIGVKSSAVLFADMDRLLIGVMKAMMLGALVLVGRNLHFGRPYEGGLAAAGVLFLWQQWLIRKRDPAGCMRAFLNNQYVGLVVFVGILLQYVYAS